MAVLDGRVVLVTGAGGGIGQACAIAAAAAGARVVVNDLGGSLKGDDPGSTSPADATVAAIRDVGGEAVANSDSVADYAAVAGMVEQAMDVFGGLDAIINPAGILRDGMFHKMTQADWDAVLEVHLRGAFNVSRAAVEHFRNQGRGAFVHFTSTSGLIGNIGQANYAAAKMGVVGLSRILAMEGAAKGVRSNVIAPFAWTRMIASIPVADEAAARRVERMRTGMRPDQVAQLAVTLAADGASSVNGQVFAVRGDEVVLFSQPRPVASVARTDGWTRNGSSPRGCRPCSRASPTSAPPPASSPTTPSDPDPAMRRAAIVTPVRTPVGKFLGALASVPVEDLCSVVVREVVSRSGVDPAAIEDVVFAQSYANSETPCVGRWAALAAGLPIEVPGMQLDRRCGGGLQSIAMAAMMVQTGAADVVLAGGVESMSNIEYYTTAMRGGARAGSVQLHDRLDRGRERSQPTDRFGVISSMIETAENLAREHQIARDACDAFAAESHARAAAAWAGGRFADEVVAVAAPQRRGDPVVVQRDEGIRSDATLDTMAALRPLMKGGVTTAGNASQQNDAAAACLVVAEDRLEALGVSPMGFLVGWAAAGCHPATMGFGPVPAVERLFARIGLGWNDIGLVELNEAFAAQVLAVLRGWGWDDHQRLNVNGGGISLGHPIGATGVRIMTSLLHEMRRRETRYGLETMCIGGGQGIAAVFERA